MKHLPLLDLIDLDDLEFQDLGAKERTLTLHLTVLYILGLLPNASLIQMKVFIGLLPVLAHQCYSTDLALTVAAIRLKQEGNLSALLGAGIIMDEVQRIFTLSEQEIILKELLLRKKCP